MYYLSLIIINFQNVPFYLSIQLPVTGRSKEYFVKSNILKHISIKKPPNLNSTF